MEVTEVADQGDVCWPSHDDPGGFRALHRRGIAELLRDHNTHLAAIGALGGTALYVHLVLWPPSLSVLGPGMAPQTALGMVADMILTGGAWGKGSFLGVAVLAAVIVRAALQTGEAASRRGGERRQLAGVLGGLTVAVGLAVWMSRSAAGSVDGYTLCGAVAGTIVASGLFVAMDALLHRWVAFSLLAVNAGIAVVRIGWELPPHPIVWAVLLIGYGISLWAIQWPALELSVRIWVGKECIQRPISLPSSVWALHYSVAWMAALCAAAVSVAAYQLGVTLDGFGAALPGTAVGPVFMVAAVLIGLRMGLTGLQTVKSVVARMRESDSIMGATLPPAALVEEMSAEMRRQQLLCLLGMPIWLTLAAALLPLLAPQSSGVGPLAMLFGVLLVADRVREARVRLRETALWRALRLWVASPRVPTEPAGPSWSELQPVIEPLVSLVWEDEADRRAMRGRMRRALDAGNVPAALLLLCRVALRISLRPGLARAVLLRAAGYAALGLAGCAVVGYGLYRYLGPEQVASVLRDEVTRFFLIAAPVLLLGWIGRFITRSIRTALSEPGDRQVREDGSEDP